MVKSSLFMHFLPEYYSKQKMKRYFPQNKKPPSRPVYHKGSMIIPFNLKR